MEQLWVQRLPAMSDNSGCTNTDVIVCSALAPFFCGILSQIREGNGKRAQ